MKVLSLLILCIVLVSLADALAPPTAERRAFLGQACKATVAFSTLSVATPSVAKEEYTLDTGYLTEPEQPTKKQNSGGSIVAGALAGSVLLSLPFFYQNILRLVGINNAKNPTRK